MSETCVCGHPKGSHAYQTDEHGEYVALGPCKKQDCDCSGWGVWIDAPDDDTTEYVDGDDYTPTTVECTVCGADVGRGPGGLGLMQHAGKHRREFRERKGRPPRDYQEVRDVLGRGLIVASGEQMTLAEAADQRARDARHDDAQAALDLDPEAEEGRDK